MSLRTWFSPSIATTPSLDPDHASAGPSRRPRRASGAARRALRSWLGGGLSDDTTFGRGAGVVAERLENRTLLTTLVGGDQFYFRDDRNQVNRIRLEGNITVEVVGAEINEDNNPVLRDLAGRLYRPDPTTGVLVPVELNGGLLPQNGTQAIGQIFIPGIANPTINAIAADNDGDIFAFNVIELEDQGGGGGGGGPADTAQIQLLQLNVPAAGSGNITATILENDFGAAQGFTNVTGADFNPGTGQLFIAVSLEEDTGGEGSFLYTFDVNDPNPGATLGLIGQFNQISAQGPQAVEVSTIAFQPLPQGGFGLAGVSDAGFFTGGPGGLNAIPGPGQTLFPIEVVAGLGGGGGAGGGDVTGIDFNPFTGDFLGVATGGVESPVLNICTNGRAISYGPLGAGNLTSLTFVPGLPDPFTFNAQGSYVAVDSGTDQMYFVSPINRLPAQSIWNIYVLQSDETGGISIGFVHTIDELFVPPNTIFDPIQPYEGTAGPFEVFNLNPPLPTIPVDAAGTGRTLIGARTQPGCNPNVVLNVPIDGNVPITPPVPGAPPQLQNLPPSVTSLRPGLSMNPGQRLGKFLLGGTLMGTVNVQGSIDQMYVGWLLTGNAGGQNFLLGIDVPENFHVGGDLRQLYVRAPIGTDPISSTLRDDPNYVTGFDMQVDGTLGQVLTLNALYGSIEVDNRPEDDPTTGIPDWPQREFEFKTVNTAPAFDQFLLTGDAAFFNDTFDTAEYRGSVSGLGQADMIRATGQLQATPVLTDWVDYYAAGILAGQTVGVQLFTGGGFVPGSINVGVFDPDGRLIASDNFLQRAHNVSGEYFEFTADRPGSYRFAIAQSGNTLYTNAVNGLLAVFPYELRVTNIGDIGIGGITARTQIFDLFDPGGTVDHAAGEDPGFELRNGDLGAIWAGGEFFSPNFEDTVRVENGNLRVIDANSIGFGTRPTTADPGETAAMNDDVQIDVPSGSVGLIRNRDAGPNGVLFFNFLLFDPPSIGGDFQMLDAAGSLLAQIKVDGGIGVIRADDMRGPGQSLFFANADNIGDDGIVDLIDVNGQMGVLGIGGPGISTGERGNVRYMRVGGEAFLDPFFGGGAGGIETISSPGEEVFLRDDSGSTMTFTPSVQVFNPAFDPVLNPGVPQFLAPDASLTIRSYPIRNSGGVAVMDITSTNMVEINGSGDEGATAEIGAIVINGQGQPVLHQTLVSGSQGGRVVPIHPRRSRNAVNDLVDFTNPFDPINPGANGGLGEPDYQDAPSPLFIYPQPRDMDGDGTLDEDLDFDGIPDGPVSRPQPFQQNLDLTISGSARVDVFDIIGGYGRNATGATADPLDGQFNRISNTTGGEIVNMTINSVGEIISDGNIGIAEPHVSGVALNPIRLINGPNTPTPNNTTDTTGASPFMGQRTGIVVTGDVEADEPGNVLAIRSKRSIGNIIVGGSIGQVIADSDGNHDLNDGVFEGIAAPIWANGSFDPPPQASPDPGGDIYNIDIGEGIAPGGSGAFSRAGIFASRRIDTVRGTNAFIRGDIFAGDVGPAVGGQITGATEPYETVVPVAPPPGGGGNAAVDQSLVPIGSGPNGRELIPDSIGRVLLKGGSIINADIVVADLSSSTFNNAFGLVQQEAQDDIDNPFYEIGQVTVTGGGGIIGSQISAADVGAVTVKNGFGVFTTITGQVGDSRFKGVDADGYGIRGYERDGGASQNYVIARGDGSSISTTRFDPQVRLSENFAVDPYFGTLPGVLTDIHAVLGTNASTPEIPGRTDSGVLEDSAFRMQRDLGKVTAYQVRANNPAVGRSEWNVGNTINQVHVRSDINGLAITTGRIQVFRPNGDVFNMNMTVAGPIKNMLIQGDLAGNSQIMTNGRVGNIQFLRINGRLDGTVRANGKIGKMFVGEAITGRISSSRPRGRGNALDMLTIGGPLGEGNLEIEGNVGKIIVAGDLGRTGENLFIRGSIKSLQVNGNLFSNVIVRDKLSTLKVGKSIMAGSLVQATQIGSVSVGGDFQAGATLRAKKLGKVKVAGQNLGNIEIVP